MSKKYKENYQKVRKRKHLLWIKLKLNINFKKKINSFSQKLKLRQIGQQFQLNKKSIIDLITLLNKHSIQDLILVLMDWNSSQIGIQTNWNGNQFNQISPHDLNCLVPVILPSAASPPKKTFYENPIWEKNDILV